MIPSHLSSYEAKGAIEGEPIAQYEVGPLRNFNYFIIDWEAKKLALIDAQKGIQVPLKHFLNLGFQLELCLFTHSHFDHISGLSEVFFLSPQTPFGFHPDDFFRLEKTREEQPKMIFKKLADQEWVRIGQHQIQCLHTPGHSPGALCYWLKNSSPQYFVSGDTLFIRDCGRTDLDAGSDSDLFQSLQKIKTLPKDLVILPGHHYSKECASLLSKELQTSPPLLCKTLEAFKTLP